MNSDWTKLTVTTKTDGKTRTCIVLTKTVPHIQNALLQMFSSENICGIDFTIEPSPPEPR